jgi:ferredoxin-NADP reductase
MSEQRYPEHILRLKRKEEIARDTVAFYFDRPADFSFVAGQNMKLFFPELNGEMRTFTIASAPQDDELVFAMRMRGSEFKNKLLSLPLGSEVDALGPTGHKFMLHEDITIPAVFIAGGIGIAPALSIISDVTHKQLPYAITLFYSNRKGEDVAFMKKLSELEAENPRLTLVPTLSQDEHNASWTGEKGRMNGEMLQKYLKDISRPYFYIAGPPEMVVGMRDVLEKLGVPEEHIFTKKFSGY